MQRNYDLAISQYHTLLHNDASNAILWNKLGVTLLQKGDLRQARKALQRALQAKSDYPDALNNLAAVYILDKNYDKAIKPLKKALSLEETRAVFHVNLGEAWFGKNQIEYAMTEYARALELDPDILQNSSSLGVAALLRTREQQASFSYLLAKTYARHGNMGEALTQLKRAHDLGYDRLGDVFKDQDFAPLWKDARLKQAIGR
jgi:tetratricopeptide (TPR) repeat protein